MSSASRVPSTTLISMPVSDLTRSTNSVPSLASRIAAVPSAITSSAFDACAIWMKRLITSSASVIAGSPSAPVFATRSPSRRVSLSRTSGRNVPSRRASTTIMWNELLPRSSAAMRTIGSGRSVWAASVSRALARVSSNRRCAWMPRTCWTRRQSPPGSSVHEDVSSSRSSVKMSSRRAQRSASRTGTTASMR